MRIAVFIKATTFHKGFGGFETQNKTLCEGLVGRGYEVVVFSPQKELSELEKLENGVKYSFVPCIFKRFSSIYFADSNNWDRKAYEAFESAHQEKPFNLVIGQSSWALPVIKRRGALGVKIISISHGSKMSEFQTELKGISGVKDIVNCVSDIPHTLRSFFGTQREFIHGSDKIIAVSNDVKEALVDETYVAPGKVAVIHNGVDPKKFSFVREERKSSDPVNLIYVGRVIRVKGLFVLLQALSEIKEKSFVLDIIGDGKDKEGLEKFSSSLGLSDRVNFVGQVKYEDVIKKIVNSDVFLLPTLRIEGFPMTIVEAMFAGLPSVVSDMGGNSDAVVDGKTGYLVEPGNKEMLKDRICDLISDSEKRRHMGENARNRALNEFTIDMMLNNYENVFKEVLG